MKSARIPPMLGYLRRKQKIFISVLILLISVVFVFWGFYGDITHWGESSANVAARVNGQAISTTEFFRHYENISQFYRNLLQGQFDAEAAERFRLKETTLNSLVEQRLLLQAVQKMGYRIPDEQVREAIEDTVYFQKNGQFDRSLYLNILKANRLKPIDYEASRRQDLLLREVSDLLKDHLKITNFEAFKEFQLAEEKINVQFVKVDATVLLQKITLQKGEADTFLKTDDGKKRIEEFYKKNASRYSQPERVKARHILIKVEEDKAEAWKKALAKIQEIQKTTTPANFAEMAKKHSQDAAAEGGDLGFFGRGVMVKEFDQAVFDLKMGAISAPIKTKYGYHLIYKEDYQPEKTETFETVQAAIAEEILKKEKAQAELKEQAQKIAKSPDLETTTKTTGFKLEETGLFSLRQEFIPKIGAVKEVRDVLSQLTKENPSWKEPIAADSQYFVVRLKEKKVADPTEFHKKQDQLRQQLVSQKENLAFTSWLEALRKNAKIKINQEILTY